ncbi:MAG: hypothetical protein ACRC6T_05780 [Sarcina sp.]
MKRDNMKTRVIGWILVAVVGTVSLGIYLIHKREAHDKKQIIISEANAVNNNNSSGVDITVQKNDN